MAVARTNPVVRAAHTEQERERRYKRLYGITIADYEAMLEFQEGVCAICERPPRTLRLAVDHDHKTGKVRGLLCNTCNQTLHERVTVDWLYAAYQYLDVPPVHEALGRTPEGVKGRVSKRRRRRAVKVTKIV